MSLDARSRARINESVAALRRHLKKHGYNLTPEEEAALDRRDGGGFIGATFVLHGFPVNSNQPWLDPSGLALAVSTGVFDPKSPLRLGSELSYMYSTVCYHYLPH